LVARHPVAAFLALVYGLGWPLLAAATVTGHAQAPVLLVLTYVVLLGSGLTVTGLADGPAAVRRLLGRLLIWRFGLARWAVVLTGMPVLTLAVAAASGTLRTPAHGWWALAGGYLFQTVVVGALTVNLAEETGWSGVVQTRLAERHGVLRAAVLTAPLFVAIHLPLQFAPGWTWPRVALGTTVLLVVAPVFRYLLGDHLRATGGSLLAVGLQHASFNASGNLVTDGGWQFLPAVFLLVLGIVVTRRLSAARHPGANRRPGIPTPITHTPGKAS
jgi:membrane protease YdiL (CAAX protease family)